MRWLSLALKKTGQREKARSLWEEMLTWPYKKDSFPYIELAKYFEHCQKDYGSAIAFVDKALAQPLPVQEREIEPLLHRRRRLEQKKGVDAP
jgi:tetratricopeptide (TPR) repeat protein